MTQRITWKLAVCDDFQVTFTGEMDDDGDMTEPEVFARRLAAELGWAFAENSDALLKAV